MLVERRPRRGGLELLEAADQGERFAVEEGEFLLYGDREIGARLIRLPCLPDQLAVGELLRFTH